MIVSADFVSQESRIAVQPLTDCRAGRHNSSPWTKSVMSGNKAEKTDVHNMTAKALGISRSDAKGINFMIQYMGGMSGLSNQIALIKGCPKSQSDSEAAQFMKHLKGPGGIAESTFAALKYQTFVADLRTYLLGVKCPNSINYRYVPDDRSFTTLRGNWPIQSAGVDEKHTLIAIIDIICDKKGIDARFACEIHDRVAYFCPEEQADKLAAVFDLAMGKLMELSLEQAAKFWDTIHPLKEPRPVLEPDPKWCKFEKVYVSKTLAEA
jgi:DNA polymerase gamma 1